jgi:hypothetical protein
MELKALTAIIRIGSYLLIMLLGVATWFMQRMVSQNDAIALQVQAIRIDLAKVDLPKLDARVTDLERNMVILKERQPSKSLTHGNQEESQSDDHQGTDGSTYTSILQASAPYRQDSDRSRRSSRDSSHWWPCAPYLDDRRGGIRWLSRPNHNSG